ncbi:hypothetical protein [Lapillicoccus sp.]|uniref:hypothetical protein n=1 Tax=Lapillicoccus sp. TaxID=1909287 RepID=UPI0025FD213B|nr:hypothetical protein [Lapillicoccus sp.]
MTSLGAADPSHLFLTFDVAIPDVGSAALLFEEWLHEVMPILDQRCYEVACEAPELITFRPPRLPVPIRGEPNGAWIAAWVRGEGVGGGSRSFAASQQALLAHFKTMQVGETLLMDFRAMGADGYPAGLGRSGFMDFGLEPSAGAGVVARLWVRTEYWERLFAGMHVVKDLVDDYRVLRGCGGIREDVFAEQWASTFGQDEDDVRGRTDVVTTYNWITLVSASLTAEIADGRLVSGRQTLAECDVLTSGALWLKATADPRDYGPRAAAVVEVLDAVLPEGKPAPSWIPQAYAPLVTDEIEEVSDGIV